MSERGEQEERARAREALVGTTIASRYVLRAVVGHGGMGAVYEAEDAVARTRVAIKFIDSEFATDERVVARFAREARAMNAVASEHIVSVLDAGTEGGRPYLVMELLRGEDLGQRLRRTRRVPLGEAMHVVAQVLKGLAKAHAAGIVHRDLKPDNVFLVGNAADSHFVKIVDFGVSKIERPRDKTTPLALTGRGTVLGTPFYMAPEQAQALPDVDARADLYSVGAILFECLSGRPPHTGETYEQVILSICMRDAPDLRAIDPKLPAPVASFVARALSRDRDERFRSAERMLAALHEVAPEEKTRVPLDSGPPETLASGGTAPLVAQERSRVVDARPVSNPALGVGTRIGGSGASDPALPVAPWASTPEVPREVHAPAQPAPVVSAIAPPPAPIRLAGERAPAGAESSARARRRAIALIVVTAIVATLTGIGVTLAIIFTFANAPSRPAPSATSPRKSPQIAPHDGGMSRPRHPTSRARTAH